MSKAEEFIQEHTSNCSNQYDLPEYFENGIERLKEYQPWLSPDQALRAVEIAREEIYEWLQKVSFDDYKVADKESYRKGCPYDYINIHGLINDLKQAMKDE